MGLCVKAHSDINACCIGDGGALKRTGTSAYEFIFFFFGVCRARSVTPIARDKAGPE